MMLYMQTHYIDNILDNFLHLYAREKDFDNS